MLNASSSSNLIGIYKRRSFKIMVCAVTLVAFFVNIFAYDIALLRPLGFVGQAWAARTPSELTGVSSDRAGSPGLFKELSVSTFKLPEYLGSVKHSWSPSNTRNTQYSIHNTNRIVIHLQDAHCNYSAQRKIAEIIEYLNKEYGVSQINLEGGAKDYDLSIFTNISDKVMRNRASDYFVKEGLVNGAEYFAINNPEKVILWGIEDTKLYIDNLKVYRDSLKHKEEIDEYLKEIGYILNKLKMQIYSKELLEFDTKYSQYKAEKLEFKEYLNYLIQVYGRIVIASPVKDGTKPACLTSTLVQSGRQSLFEKEFPNIYLLSQTLSKEPSIDFNEANRERDALIDDLQKKLSRNSLEQLLAKTVEFRLGRISDKDFYAFLINKAKGVDVKLKGYPELEKYISYVTIYNAVDKTRAMEEAEKLENKIQEFLSQNDKQKELILLLKNLTLLKNIFNTRLTKDDYRYYKENEDAFNISRFRTFIEKNRDCPQLYSVIARSDQRERRSNLSASSLDENIDRLDDYRINIEKFYEYSLKRDQAFIRNLKLSSAGQHNTQYPIRNTILITGGFHSENLAELFKKNNIAYISIMPNFKNENGYECPYFNILSGGKNLDIIAILPSVLKNALATASQLNPSITEALKQANLSAQVPLAVSKSATTTAPSYTVERSSAVTGDWKGKIPFYRFINTKSSLKAAAIFVFGVLMVELVLLVGGWSVWDFARSHLWGSSAYAFLITIITTCTIFSAAEITLIQLLLFFSPAYTAEAPPPAVEDREFPSVTAQIAIRNEPPDVVLETLESVMRLDYPVGKLRVQIVDNTDMVNSLGKHILRNRYEQLRRLLRKKSFVRDFRQRYGYDAFQIMHRKGTEGYKSGNLNLGLSKTDSDYILQLDADSIVSPETLRIIMPEFVHHERNRSSDEPRLAYIQIALDVKNRDENSITWTIGKLHNIYEFFLNSIRKHYCFVSSTGHHMIYSKEAIIEAGGHPEDIGVGEDIDLAIGIQVIRDSEGRRKWIGKRVDYLRLPETVPSDFEALKTQRWRWAFGSTRVLIKRFSQIIHSPLKWYEKSSLLFDLSIFLQGTVMMLASLSIPPLLMSSVMFLEGTEALSYPVFLAKFVILSWLSIYTLYYVIALIYLEKGSVKESVNTLKAFFGGLSTVSALIATIQDGAIKALYNKSTPFRVTPRKGESRGILKTMGINKMNLFLGIYLLAFIPFIPIKFGYTVPALIIGLSLALWPFHLLIGRGLDKLSKKITMYKSVLQKHNIVFDKEATVSKKLLILGGVGIFIIAVFLRFYNLNYLGPWIDEATYINAGRDFLNPNHHWGWISGWKYGFPLIASASSWLFSSFVGARWVTAILGMGVLLFTYLFSRLAIADLMPKDKPALNEKRSLYVALALSIALPLIYISRLATYDALAYFFFALSLYLLEYAAHAAPTKQKRFYMWGAMTLGLAVMSKYVVMIFIPFLAAYTLMSIKDKKVWVKKFILPAGLVLGSFFIFFGGEVAAGIAMVPKGWWVSMSLGGLMVETIVYLFPYLVLMVIGFFSIDKEKRSQASWLMIGALFLLAYHLYDRHMQGFAKSASVGLIITSPLIGIGFSKLSSLKVNIKKWINLPAKLILFALLFAPQLPQRYKTAYWADSYVPVEIIKKYAESKENPKIFTTRPQELILLARELEPFINRTDDLLSVAEWQRPYISTTYSVDRHEILHKIRTGYYDIVHLEPAYWYYNPDDPTVANALRKSLKRAGYVEVLHDNKPVNTSFGMSSVPSDSKVFVHQRLMKDKSIVEEQNAAPAEHVSTPWIGTVTGIDNIIDYIRSSGIDIRWLPDEKLSADQIINNIKNSAVFELTIREDGGGIKQGAPENYSMSHLTKSNPDENRHFYYLIVGGSIQKKEEPKEPEEPATMAEVTSAESASTAASAGPVFMPEVVTPGMLTLGTEEALSGLGISKEDIAALMKRAATDEAAAKALEYLIGVYATATRLAGEINSPQEERYIFIPYSKALMGIENIVINGKMQDVMHTVRHVLKAYRFNNVNVSFYDGTLAGVDGLKIDPTRMNSSNTVAYVPKEKAKEAIATLDVTVVQEKTEEGRLGYLSVGGHVILALGLLDLLKRQDDLAYFNLVFEHFQALANNKDELKQYAANRDSFIDHLKKGYLVIELPPIDRAEIDRDMIMYFAAEKSIGTSL